MDQINLSPSGASIKTAGLLDYVQDGSLYLNGSIRCIMVTSGDDLAELTDVTPGSIAHTAGYTAMWQLGADGEWVPVFDFSGSDSDSADDNASDDAQTASDDDQTDDDQTASDDQTEGG